MYQRKLMARMGDGTVRRVADQYEAERIKRETGDRDMFVFQESETDDREEEQSLWGPVTGHRKPARRKSLLSPDNEDDDTTGNKISNPAANKQQRAQAKFPTNPMAKPLFKSQAKPQSKPLSGPVTGHAAASLNQDGSTKVRMLDKGLDPAVPVQTKKKPPANPCQQARTLESKAKKANAPKPRNPYQDARCMEKKAEKMLEPSVAGKIFNGLGELWTKAPAGIAEGMSEGAKGTKKAIGGLVDTFLHDEGMHEGLKQAGKYALIGASIPAVMVGGAYAATQAPAAYGTLLGNPQLINEGTDFVRGVFDKGSPPPASLGGYAGGGLSEFVERVRKKKPRD